MEIDMQNCASCGKPNGVIAVGQPDGQAIPMCIDCYERLQAIQLQQVHMYQYMAWKAEEDMNDHFESWGVPVHRRPPPPKPNTPRGSIAVNNINVSGSQIGALNTGTIGTFAASINLLKQVGKSDLADRLNGLTSEVIKSSALAGDIKKELVEQLGAIAEEAAKEPNAQRASLAKALVKRVTELLGHIPVLNQLWENVRQLLSIIFP